MQALLQYADQSQKKVYFLGGKPAVISALKNVIEKKYPHLVIAGMHDGYFNDEEPIVHEIQQAQPDFIFVALGFPKQDFFHRPSPVYCQFDLDGRRRQFRRFDRQRSTGP